MYDKFSELLNSTHTTVADFCRATGLKESSLSNWKKRDKGINTDTLIVICKHFGVSSDWFLDLSNSKMLMTGEKTESLALDPQVRLEGFSEDFADKLSRLNECGRKYIEDQLEFALQHEKYLNDSRIKKDA